MKQMTSRERVLAALKNRDTDRMVWSPLIDQYFISSLPSQGYHMNILETARYIGCDFIERHVANPSEIKKHVEIREVMSSDRKSKRVYYDTPVGSVYAEWLFSGETIFLTKHMIESLEDMKIYQHIIENEVYESNGEQLVIRDREIGDSGIAAPSGKMSPIQELLQFLCGVENTVYLKMDYPDEMDELLEAMHQANLRQYRVLAQYPADVIFSYEDTSSTVMSRDMFVQYSVPVIDEYAKILQDSGKVFITHMCGKLSAFAEEIGRGRQNGIDSVCPPTTGDLSIWEARRIWGPDKVILGGIEPPALARMTKAEVVRTVAEILEKLPERRGIILSTGDAVPYGTPIENLKVIAEYICQYT